MKVSSHFELYLQRSDLRPASVRFKRQALRYLIGWFGDIEPQHFTIAIAEDYRIMLLKGRKKVSVNGYLSNIKPFFSWEQVRILPAGVAL